MADEAERLLDSFKRAFHLYSVIGATGYAKETNAALAEYQEARDAVLAAMRRAAPPPVGPSEAWRPIETAPKDGTACVLCWGIDAEGEPIDWTINAQTAGVFVQVASWWVDDDGANGEWMVYTDQPAEPRLHFNPTHWMPLPQPPAIAALRAAKGGNNG
jgi:hypothetical protein